MKTFTEWLKDNYNEEMPKGDINAKWFIERDLPMIVHCSCCDMTMVLPNAYIDDDGYTYCSSCKGDD